MIAKAHVRIWTACILLVSGIASHAAETIEVDGKKAHPTRVLAQFRPEIADQVQAQAAGGEFQVLHRYSVTGLVLLDPNVGLARQNVAAGDQEGALKARIAALQQSGLFQFVEPDYVVQGSLTPTDPAFVNGTLWGLRNQGQNGGVAGNDINVVPAWDVTTGSRSIVVAVIDSGVNYRHRELAPQMWRNPGEVQNGLDDDGDGYVDNIFGINAVADSGDPDDDNGHGTHVSGTIGAVANDGNSHVGVAWNVQIMACKFLAEDGFGFTSDAIQCVDFAVENGARILQNSWGGGAFSQALLNSIIKARDAGVLFVASAGNEGTDNDAFPRYPSAYQVDNIIAVAALDRFNLLADFSNFGATNVHLGAPGVEIYSTWIGSDNAYNTIDGTSMAAPHVSGAAVLLWSTSTNATYSEIRQRLLNGVTAVPSLRNRTLTGGRLNVARALFGSEDGTLELFFTPSRNSFIQAGSTQVFQVTVTDDLGVTNATVTGTFEGTTGPVIFRNDGAAPDEVALDSIYTAQFIASPLPGNYPLQLTISAPLKQSVTTNVFYQVVLPPSNDLIANAIKIKSAGDLVEGDNRLATIEPNEQVHANVPGRDASIWWSWSPSFTGPVIVDAAGTSFDSVLAVYRGTSIDNLSQVAAADNIGTKMNPYVTFDVTAGATYYIAVAGANPTARGFVRLRIERNGTPDSTPPVVTILEPVSGIVLRRGEPHVRISGTAFDPQPNSSGVVEVQVQVNDNLSIAASGTTNWASTNLLEMGLNRITVKAIDAAENISAQKTITVTYQPLTTTNDIFALAPMLTNASGTVSADNSNAQKEFGEPNHGGNEGGHSVWWSWRAPSDGALFVTTDGSDIDTLLGIYTGTTLPTLVRIGSNDDTPNSQFAELIVGVRANTLYRIAVDGFGGKTGVVSMTYSFTPSVVFSVAASSLGNGVVSFGPGNYPINSAVSLLATPNPGYDFDRWEDVNGNVLSTRNPFTFQLTGPVEARARFKIHTFTEDFENGFNRLPWVTQGFVVQSATVADGAQAASSGSTANNSTNRLTLFTMTQAGQGSFDYLVSSEKNYDKLEFRLNGVIIGSWSGQTQANFARFTFDVPEGTNSFEWSYVKDFALADGLDAGFIDNIDLPISLPQITIAAGRIFVHARPNMEMVLESSSDLNDWNDLVTLTTDNEGNWSTAVPSSVQNGLFLRVRK
ncbi:MAG: S8 family serine peptidase [Verrucomicrobiota bacterium]|nr:S8 family serine peptidase [Verrucomicrobiota bacterium]